MIKNGSNSVVTFKKSPSDENFEFINLAEAQQKSRPSLSYEFVNGPVSNEDDTDVPLITDFERLTEDELSLYFDRDGRVINEAKLREAIFNGGCHPDIRIKVWPYLFGLYPMMSTEREKKEHFFENYFRYYALKRRCFDYINTTDLCPMSTDFEASPTELDIAQFTFESHQNLAEIFAKKQQVELSAIDDWYRVIDKDIPRTDIDHPFFFDDKQKRLNEMRNILITFGFFHPNIGYCQGMNDILTNFMVVLRSEEDAYWCFSNYMESVEHDFSETGMIEKINQVRSLLQELEPNLFSHFRDCNVPDLMFCHRWLLVSFKREFEYEDSIRYFEIVKSQHLKFDSHAALSTQDDQFRQEVLKNQGESLSCPSFENIKYTLDVFVCVSVIMTKRQEFLACKDTAEVFNVACHIRGTLNLKEIHHKAYMLFMKYCRKFIQEYSSAKEEKSLFKVLASSISSLSNKIPISLPNISSLSPKLKRSNS